MIDLDITDLLETLVRRERALNTGSSHIPRDQRTHAGPRDDAQSPLDRPLLRWPSERRAVPASCWHCGAGRAHFEVEAPHGAVRHGEVRCLACSRVVVRLRDDGTRPMTAAQFAALPAPKPGPRGSVDHASCAGAPGCQTCRMRRYRERQRAGATP